MRKKWLLVGIGLLMAIFAGAAVACGEDDDGTTGGAEFSVNDTPVAGIQVAITSPESGSTVTSPVTLAVSIEGAVLVPASEGQEGAVHYAAFVDAAGGSVATGTVVGRGEEGEGVYQFGVGSTELILPPGEHTVSVGVADNDDLLLAGVTFAEVTFTVEEQPTPSGG